MLIAGNYLLLGTVEIGDVGELQIGEFKATRRTRHRLRSTRLAEPLVTIQKRYTISLVIKLEVP